MSFVSLNVIAIFPVCSVRLLSQFGKCLFITLTLCYASKSRQESNSWKRRNNRTKRLWHSIFIQQTIGNLSYVRHNNLPKVRHSAPGLPFRFLKASRNVFCTCFFFPVSVSFMWFMYRFGLLKLTCSVAGNFYFCVENLDSGRGAD